MLECVHHVQANLNSDGEFEVKIRSRVEYEPGAWAQAEVPIPEYLQQRVKDALQAIIDSANDDLAEAADQVVAAVVQKVELSPT